MVQLTVDGKKICFNLKDKDREHGLYCAWYSMSDMPTHKTKKLKITTDKGKELCYAVEEIEDCQYIDKVYEEDSEKTASDIYDEFFPEDDFINQGIKKPF